MQEGKVPFLFTPIQTAKILGISRSKVYALLNTGALNSVHIGRSRRITQNHVQEFIDSLEVVA
jgi:excisionase family DNA binding protein